jgi:hypothetical protein
MSVKSVKTRIQNKHDVAGNWTQATNFVPLAGELIVYDKDYDATSNPTGSKYPRIKIGDGVLNSETNTITGTTVSNLPFFEAAYTNTEPLLNDVGGIKASAHANGFNNIPITDLLTELLYPYTKPVINSFSLNPPAGVKKKGAAFTLTAATATITKKSKPISKVALYRGSTEIASSSAPISDGTVVTFSGFDSSAAAIPGTSNETFYIKVSEADGTANVVTSEAKYTFVDPYYVGVIEDGSEITSANIKGLTEKVEAKGQKAYTYTTTATQCAVIAYPASYGNLSKITDANNFTQTWTKHTISIDNVSYYVYVSGNAAATNFKYTFSY